MSFSNGIPDLTTLYETKTMMGLFEDIRAPQNFWRTLMGNQAPMVFDTEAVMFEKIFKDRKAAPYVRPLSEGVSSYDKQSEVRAFKPAFIKLNDVVGPSQYYRKQPGTLMDQGMGSAVAREAAATRDILQHQRDLIDNRLEQMAAEVMLSAALVLEGPEYPRRELNFNRDTTLDLTLAPGLQWGDAGVSIIQEIAKYARAMFDIKFGGSVGDIVMGSNAADLFIRDPEVRELLSLDIRGTTGNMNIGPSNFTDAYQIAEIGAGQFGFPLKIWVNRQKLIIPDPVNVGQETEVALMDPDTILLVSSGYQAVEAYGLIPNAVTLGVGPVDVLTRSYISEGANVHRHIITETAPIMVPIHENKTMRVKVR